MKNIFILIFIVSCLFGQIPQVYDTNNAKWYTLKNYLNQNYKDTLDYKHQNINTIGDMKYRSKLYTLNFISIHGSDRPSMGCGKDYGLEKGKTFKLANKRLYNKKYIQIKVLNGNNLLFKSCGTFRHGRSISLNEQNIIMKSNPIFINILNTDLISINSVVMTFSEFKSKINGMFTNLDNQNIHMIRIFINQINSMKNTFISNRNQFYNGKKYLENYINKAKLHISELQINTKLTIAISKNNIKVLENYISQNQNTHQSIEALEVLIKLVFKTNQISAYKRFINKYPDSHSINIMKENIDKNHYKFFKDIKQNDLKSYFKYIELYPKSKYIKNILINSYTTIKKQNNISGYEWFINKYPQAPQSKEAIKSINILAYNKAKQINTISAYNTFVYAYPYASQVKESNDNAYNLESKKYTDIGMIAGFFQKEATMEKKARGLLVRAKQIERISHDYNGNAKAGYIIVANRMYQLLQDKFIDSKATLDYMNSLDFKDFTTSFKQAMKDIKYILTQINNNTSDISKYAQDSINISKQGFADAKADREMSRYKDEQHHKWDKLMHLKDKGYAN